MNTNNMNSNNLTSGFASTKLLISLQVPDRWEAAEPSPDMVRFYSPEHPEYNCYQATFSVTLGRPDGFGDKWFDDFCRSRLEQLKSSNRNFKLRSEEIFSLSSLAEVCAVWYEWEPDPDLAFAQLQALIPYDAYRLYLINASALSPLLDTYLPLFDSMMRSLRILPVKS